MKNAVFEKISKIEAPVEEVFKWHARLGAIERYSPPWDPIAVIHRSGGIEKNAKVVIRMKAGPVPFHWHALHTDYEENRLFRDKQMRGPFAEWIHTHEFEPDGSQACFIKDSIQYRLLPHPLRKSISYRLVENKLSKVFAYRHHCLQHDLRVQMNLQPEKPLTILVTGSSGLIGSNLIPFLTTAGHKVIKLVRRNPMAPDELFWDPQGNQLDIESLKGIDAVVHLAGENIGEGRWTLRKKESILSSRLLGTRLLADTISQMDSPPKVFLSASAVGFYGNRGETELIESDVCGDDFISEVCQKWEAAAMTAEKSGIRTATLRIGVVLDPRGGIMERLLPLNRLGFGVRVSPGSQYISWISLNDTIDAIYHLIVSPGVNGPVNLVAPTVITSDELSRQMAAATFGKIEFKIPETAIKLLFGEKGQEILLTSTRVKPEKLINSGFHFRYHTLNQLFNHILGKES